MAALSEIVGATTGMFELIDRLEQYVKRYVARKDLAEDNVELYSRLENEHEKVFQLIEAIERSELDNIPLYNKIIRTGLDLMKSRLQSRYEKLIALKGELRKAGAMSRVRRANEVLEEYQKGLTEFHSFLTDTLMPWLRENDQKDNVQESYNSQISVPINPPGLTFEYNSPDTPEGRLKAAILGGSKSGIVGVVASGIGGVGKTCAVRGLAKDPDIKQIFAGGILYISLGNYARGSDIVNEIARAVQKTGGDRLSRKIKGLEKVKDASESAAQWFRPHKCLFLVDDIWWVNGITSDVFRDLGMLLHDESLLVYTTRDRRFLRGADKVVKFEKREPLGDMAQQMLMNHAGFAGNALVSSANQKALRGILDICNGLPLAFGIAGAAVREYCDNREVNKEDGWSDYYSDLKSNRESIAHGSAEEYGPVRLVVDSSLEVLRSEREFGERFEDMFEAFCVLRRKQKVDGQVLQKLWSMNEMGEVRKVAQKFKNVSLVQMTTTGESGDTFCVQLHDVVLGIAKRKALEKNKVKGWFKALISSYIPKEQIRLATPEAKSTSEETAPSHKGQSGISSLIAWARRCFHSDNDIAEPKTIRKEEKVMFTSWWDVPDDGFIHDNVCRLLQGAGETEALLWLLNMARWIVMRLQKSGINGLEGDLEIGKKMAKKCTKKQKEVLTYLDLVGSAARMSCLAIADNPCEAWFLMYGRVAWFAKHCELTQAFMSDIREHAPRPWVQASVGILDEAGGAALETMRIEHCDKILSISHAGDVIRILWVDWKGEACVTEYYKTDATQKVHRLDLSELQNTSSVEHHADTSDDQRSSSSGHSFGFGTFLKRNARCKCGAFSDNLKRLVTGYNDGRIVVRDIDCEYNVAKCLESSGFVKHVAISGDGKTIVSASQNSDVLVWDASSPNAVGNRLEGLPENAEVESIAVSFDGNKVITSSYLAMKRVKRVKRGWVVMSRSSKVGTSSDSLSASSSNMEETKDELLDERNSNHERMKSDSLGENFSNDEGVKEDSLDESRNNDEGTKNELLNEVGHCDVGMEDDVVNVSSRSEVGIQDELPEKSSSDEDTEDERSHGNSSERSSAPSIKAVCDCRIWDREMGDTVALPPEMRDDNVKCVATSGDGRKVASGLLDGTIRVWKLGSTEKPVLTMKGRATRARSVTSVALSADGKRLVSASYDHTVVVWNAETGGMIGMPVEGYHTTVVGVSADGKEVVTSISRNAIRVWNMENMDASNRPERCTRRVSCAAYFDNGTRIVTGSLGGCVRVWNAESGERIGQPLEGHKDEVTCVAVSADGNRIVSGSDDGSVIVWDANSGAAVAEPLSQVEGEELSFIDSVAVNNDGTRVVFSCPQKVFVWDVESGGVTEVTRDAKYSRCVAMSADGARVAFVSWNKPVIVWDVDSRQAVGPPLEEKDDSVECLALSGDGKRVVSGSRYRTARVWDVASGEAIGDPFVHDRRVTHAQLDADGSRVVTYDDRGYGRLWDVARGQCVMTSTEAEWASTAYDFPELANFQSRRRSGDRRITEHDVAGQEQVLASPDRRVCRFRDMYFAEEHGHSLWPVCRVIR